MSVFNAMVKMKNYIENCPTDDMKEAAKNDFIEAIKEYIAVGYTWGRRPPLPFDLRMLRRLNKKELHRLNRMLLDA